MPTKRDNKWYGRIPDLPDIRDVHFSLWAPPLVSLPSSIDLRQNLPNAYNQEALGSCTANMGTGIYQFNQSKEGISWHIIPARLFLYWNTRDIEGTTGTDSGASIRDTIKAMASTGMCMNNDWPYNIENFTTKPSQQCYDFAINHTAIVYASVEQDINQIKSVLAGGEVIGIGFSVYSGFESPDVAQTGLLNLPLANETLLGGHAVVVCGYDDATQRLWVRNSWGTDWGVNGYFTMPYAYITNPDLASDFWVVRSVK